MAAFDVSAGGRLWVFGDTRLVRLAREGTRYSPQFLQRFSPERRYATLVAFLLETSTTFTDEAIELHDRLIGQYHNQSRHAYAEQFQQSGRAINEKVRLFASVGAALISAREAAVDPYQAIEAILPWTTFVYSPRRNNSPARRGSILWRCWPPPFHVCAATPQPSWTVLSFKGRTRVNRCWTDSSCSRS